MKKSKLFKILFLPTLIFGGGIGATISLVSCDSANSKADISELTENLFKNIYTGDESKNTAQDISDAISTVIKSQKGFEKWSNSSSGVVTKIYKTGTDVIGEGWSGKAYNLLTTTSEDYIEGATLYFCVNVKGLNDFKDAKIGDDLSTNGAFVFTLHLSKAPDPNAKIDISTLSNLKIKDIDVTSSSLKYSELNKQIMASGTTNDPINAIMMELQKTKPAKWTDFDLQYEIWQGDKQITDTQSLGPITKDGVTFTMKVKASDKSTVIAGTAIVTGKIKLKE